MKTQPPPHPSSLPSPATASHRQLPPPLCCCCCLNGYLHCHHQHHRHPCCICCCCCCGVVVVSVTIFLLLSFLAIALFVTITVALAALPIGVLHTSVRQKVMPLTLSQGYFCTIFYIRWAREVTKPSTTTQTTNKQHHHGDGDACSSSGMDSMNPCCLSDGQHCAYSFQSCHQMV